MTIIRSICCNVDNLCAIAIVVRSRIKPLMDVWMLASVSLFSADVASSSNKMGAFFKIAWASVRLVCADV